MNVVNKYRLSQIGGHSQRQKKTKTSIPGSDSNSWRLNNVEEMSRFQEFGHCAMNGDILKQAVKSWQQALPAKNRISFNDRPTRALGQGPISVIFREIETSIRVPQSTNVDASSTKGSLLQGEELNELMSKPAHLDINSPVIAKEYHRDDDSSDEEPTIVFSPTEIDAPPHHERTEFENICMRKSNETNSIDFDGIFGNMMNSTITHRLPNAASEIIFGIELSNVSVEPPEEYIVKPCSSEGEDHSNVVSDVTSIQIKAAEDLSRNLESPRINDKVHSQDAPDLEYASERSSPNNVLQTPNNTEYNDNSCKEGLKERINPKCDITSNLYDDTSEVNSSQANCDLSFGIVPVPNVKETDNSIIEIDDDNTGSVRSICFDLPTQESSSSSSSSASSESSDNERIDDGERTAFIQTMNDESMEGSEINETTHFPKEANEDHSGTFSSSSTIPRKDHFLKDAQNLESLNTLRDKSQSEELRTDSGRITNITSTSGNSFASHSVTESAKQASNQLHNEGDNNEDNITPIFRRSRKAKPRADLFLSQTPISPSDKGDEVQSEDMNNPNADRTSGTSDATAKSVLKSVTKQLHHEGDDKNEDEDTPIFHRSRTAKSRADLFLTQMDASPSQSTSTLPTPTTKRNREDIAADLHDTPLSREQLQDTPITVTHDPKLKKRRVEELVKKKRKNEDVSKFFDIEAEASTSEDDDNEDDEDAPLSQDSFINDSSQLGFTQDMLDTLDCDKSHLSNSPVEMAIHRQVNMMQVQKETFATPILARNRNRSPQLSIPSSEKNLGKMHFIRSVIEHHKKGGNADEIENEFHAINARAGTMNSQDSHEGTKPCEEKGQATQATQQDPKEVPQSDLKAKPTTTMKKKTALTAEQIARIQQNRNRALLLRQKKGKDK